MIDRDVLKGLKFGRLTVISDSLRDGGKTKVKCKCDCGTEKLVRTDALKSGSTKSCGCLHREKSSERLSKYIQENPKENKIMLIGELFGRLKVISEAEPRKYNGHNHRTWVCSCSCGKTTEVSQQKLTKGHTKSCGCLRDEQSRKNLRMISSEAQDKGWRSQVKEGTSLSVISKKKPNVNNKSGVRGVSYYNSIQKWVAELTFKGTRNRKIFSDKQAAVEQRLLWEEKYFKPILDKYSKEG